MRFAEFRINFTTYFPMSNGNFRLLLNVKADPPIDELVMNQIKISKIAFNQLNYTIGE